MNIGENIKRIRETKGMSQTELANRVFVTRSMICRLESNTKAPSLLLAKELAKVLECSVDDFLKE